MGELDTNLSDENHLVNLINLLVQNQVNHLAQIQMLKRLQFHCHKFLANQHLSLYPNLELEWLLALEL